MFETQDIGDVTVVRFTQRTLLDMQVIEQIGCELIQLVTEMGRRNLLLSLGRLDYVSSWFLGQLVTLRNRIRTAEGRLVLCGLNRDVAELFLITELRTIFTIVRDEEAGLASF